MNNDLLENLGKIHTTALGIERIKRNLNLDVEDVVKWCKDKVGRSDNIYKQGKNWYVNVDHCTLTIHAHSFTIITAHKKK